MKYAIVLADTVRIVFTSTLNEEDVVKRLAAPMEVIEAALGTHPHVIRYEETPHQERELE